MDGENGNDSEGGTATATAPAAPTSPKRILLQGVDEVEDQDMDIDANPLSNANAPGSTGAGTSGSTSATASHYQPLSTNTLISQIVTPSPFQRHNDSATADRYRSALQRITSAPTTDVEAWEAIMNECMSLYRTQLLPQLEAERGMHRDQLLALNRNSNGYGRYQHGSGSLKIIRQEILEQKLDWVESCHGHLLKYFPYSSNYFITAVEMLLARSALPFESLTGGEDDYSYGNVKNWSDVQTPLQIAAGRKLDRIFGIALGVKMDGSKSLLDDDGVGDNDGNVNDAQNVELSMAMDTNRGDKEEQAEPSAMQTLGGMCTSSIELWLLYIRKRTRDAKRQAIYHHSIQTGDINSNNGPTKSNKPIMKLTPEGEELIRNQITGAYETALGNGAAFAFQNHLVWRQYLTYVKSWNVMMAPSASTVQGQQLTGIDHTLHSKQKELLRSIYQRIITLPMLGLDGLWTEYENFEKAQSEQLAAALIAENFPKYQHARSVYLERNRIYNVNELRFGRLATPPVDYEFVDLDGDGGSGVKKDADEEDYKTKMKSEIDLLAKWKRRSGYERTNPERLSAADFTARIRQCYKDMICCFMKHIEVWHEWSTWELYNTGGTGTASSDGGAGDFNNSSKLRNVSLAVGVLVLAQKQVPDATLLAYAHAQILESQPSEGRKSDMPSPGEEAIQVMHDFCKRAGNTLGYVLLQRLVRKYKGIKEARAVFSEARRNLRIRPEDALIIGDTIGKANDAQGEPGAQATDDAIGQTATEALSSEIASGSKMVMNRSAFVDSTQEGSSIKVVQPTTVVNKKMGFLTWHLYASHAAIEHRLNKSPKVASRVYELGLKKHRSFLSTPQFVLQYSSLLLELNDEENLRALLTRAIAACEEQNKIVGDETDDKEAAARRELQRPLWDTMLKFEATLSARSGDTKAVRAIEARRRKALFGPNVEDVASGNGSARDSEIGNGVHKSSLSELLIQMDGYDTSSRIVNGLGRLVETLEVSGILGQESIATSLAALSSTTLGSIWKDDGCSGPSDASYRRRKLYQTEISSLQRVSIDSSSAFVAGMQGASSSAGRLLSAKERLAQSAAQSQNTSVMASVQAGPAWLRNMLMLLPATIRNYRGKAPPHMIEMALAALKANPLPAVRPNDKPGATEVSGSLTKRARADMNGDNSSDEEDNSGGNGYGSQFRARQRARLGANS